ncbi:MAG TPA: hypothetical protein VE871_05955 [Longimicrobium sp.]|nr:hypothetical protein [Longimicrobium sp.]
MTIEVVSFIIGGILVGTAIVGGGFEIKEIKMPRVGAGVRVVSLVVGSGFLLLAMGMWGLNNPQLMAESLSTNALMPANDTMSVVPETQRGSRSVESPQPASVEEEVVWAQDEPAAPAFTGFSSQNQVVWKADGISYQGQASFNGSTGSLRIAYVDPDTQQEQQVDQDLVLQESDGAFWYVGANPRDAYTQQMLDDSQYMEDNFRVVPDGQGGWTIDQVCGAGVCASVLIQ